MPFKFVLFLCLITAIVASTLVARSDDNLRFVRHVPEGATIQYAVKGQVLQAVDLRPGSYEIIVRRLGRTGE